MGTEYRTQVTRVGLLLLIMLGTVVGVMVTSMSLTRIADTWNDVALYAAIITILVVFFGGMVLLIRLLATRQVVYSLSEDGIREETHRRGRKPRVREVAWSDVQSYRAYTQVYSDLDFLRMRTTQGRFAIHSAKDETTQAAFSAFRDAALFHLQARGIPATRPSAARQLTMRVLGWGLLAFLILTPVYVLSMPRDQRPEIWWLRWMVLLGLASPFISAMLRAGRARE